MKIPLLMAPLLLTFLSTVQADDNSEARFNECLRKVLYDEYDEDCVNEVLAVEEKYNLCAQGHCGGHECTAICKAGIWEGSPDAIIDGPPYVGFMACCKNPDTELRNPVQWFEISANCRREGKPQPSCISGH